VDPENGARRKIIAKNFALTKQINIKMMKRAVKHKKQQKTRRI